MSADELIRNIDPKTGEEKIILGKQVNINDIKDETLKITTQAIRDQIKSNVPIYLQLPSDSQKAILNGSSDLHASTTYVKTSGYAGITVFFDNDKAVHNGDTYTSGIASITGTIVKFDKNNFGTIIDGKVTMRDSEIHEIISHPADFVKLIGSNSYI